MNIRKSSHIISVVDDLEVADSVLVALNVENFVLEEPPNNLIFLLKSNTLNFFLYGIF